MLLSFLNRNRYSQQSGDLYQPAHVVRIHIERQGPLGQFVPFLGTLPVNAEPQFDILVLGFLQIARHFLDYPSEILPVQIIVSLQEDFPKSALSDGIVLGVELVEAVKSVSVRVYVQHIDRKIVRC